MEQVTTIGLDIAKSGAGKGDTGQEHRPIGPAFRLAVEAVGGQVQDSGRPVVGEKAVFRGLEANPDIDRLLRPGEAIERGDPVPYNIFMVVAVWRSADRYRGAKTWAELARVSTVIWMLALTAA